jgi:hypothetical protein
VLEKLKSAIGETVEQFRNYPYFLSERDIQALLFVNLRNAASGLRYPYDATGVNKKFGFAEPFEIHPVTTEYHIGAGQRDRFDVAVLSNESDSALDIWRQPCQVAIEIKLWQPGYRTCDYLRDVEKLQRYQLTLQNTIPKKRAFTGIAMLFVHPNAKPGTGTLTPKENPGNPYPENGVALHIVTQQDHWWEERSSAPAIREQVDALAQTT